MSVVSAQTDSDAAGLINNLKKFPALLKLYEVLKDAKRQPTADELSICQGKLSMTTERTKELTAEYLKTHKQLDQAFEKQREKQQVRTMNDLSRI